MKIIRSVKEMIEFEAQGEIAFVPTMGALHEGHLSLIRAAKKENDLVVVSIFVNPVQFSPGEDFSEYPRDEDCDTELLLKEDIDVLFMPQMKEMYPENSLVKVSLPSLTDCLCGTKRPKHFDGVALVLVKLFNIINPTKVYFGQKDYQQAMIVKKLIDDLNFQIGFKMLPTIRESNGLAMSSRNVYLTDDEQKQAGALYAMFSEARDLVRNGERNAIKLKEAMKSFLSKYEKLKLDYIDVRRADLKEVDVLEQGRYVLAASVYLGETRLIDNILVHV